MAALFPFYLSATVWPEMRNCQNFENEGFSLKWAVEMTRTKKKLYTPRKTKNFKDKSNITFFVFKLLS